MFKDPSEFRRIYIACGYTDLRYGVDGLANSVGMLDHQRSSSVNSSFAAGVIINRIKGTGKELRM